MGPDPLCVCGGGGGWTLRYVCFEWPTRLKIYSKYCTMFKFWKRQNTLCYEN